MEKTCSYKAVFMLSLIGWFMSGCYTPPTQAVYNGPRFREAAQVNVVLQFMRWDSITRVARAYNSVHGGSGRTMTGGVDARALEIPRKMFASARKIEEGGSLTIIATALVDTGSRMDELIFQEFKGTGNMELVLDRKLSDRRLYPAIDIPKSGTRKEEKLFPKHQIEAVRKLRRMMVDLNPVEAMETLIGALKKHKTNDELLAKLDKGS